jgi:hypothetical protein
MLNSRSGRCQPLVPRSVDHRDHENRLPTHPINDAVWEAARVNPSNAAKLIAKSRQEGIL